MVNQILGLFKQFKGQSTSKYFNVLVEARDNVELFYGCQKYIIDGRETYEHKLQRHTLKLQLVGSKSRNDPNA